MPTLPDQLPGHLPNHATFAKHVGETFRVRGETGEPLDLVLAEAAKGRGVGAHPTAPDRPFVLVFVGRGASLSQRIHRLEHPQLGALELFLVPLGPGGGGMRYEAVFN